MLTTVYFDDYEFRKKSYKKSNEKKQVRKISGKNNLSIYFLLKIWTVRKHILI